MDYSKEEVRELREALNKQVRPVKLTLIILLIISKLSALAGVYIFIAIEFYKGIGLFVVSLLFYQINLAILKEIKKAIEDEISDIIND